MKQEQLNRFKKRLEEMKQEETEIAQRIEDGLRIALTDSIDELSLYDNHPGDVGDTTFERGKDLGLKLFTQDRLAMIEEALHSVDEGTYGTCESCGKEIDIERLEAVPYTTLCIDCKNNLEDLERNPRPIEEDVISPPFGGFNHDRMLETAGDAADNNAFDGEDAWQAVARYGTSESPSDIGSVENYNDTFVDNDENIGIVEDYEGIAAKKAKDGQFYQDFRGQDDEDSPYNWVNE
jgi:YteA family regulatory protein